MWTLRSTALQRWNICGETPRRQSASLDGSGRCHDIGNGEGNFAGYKILSSSGRLMVKQNPVHGIHAIRLSIVHGYPVRKEILSALCGYDGLQQYASSGDGNLPFGSL